MGYDCLSAPSPSGLSKPTRERPHRLRVLWADPTPWQPSASLLVVSAPPTWHLLPPGATRVSQVPGTSLHTSHALSGPRQTLRALTRYSALFVLASGPLTPSPSAFGTFVPDPLYRGYIKAWGIAVSLAGYVVPCVRLNCFVRFCSHLLNDLPHNCNTRYGSPSAG